jgi:hypothetical protein
MVGILIKWQRLMQGGYDPGMADSVDSYDAGGFSDFGGDFGGGDFGGIEM